ncbi:MAG TPA: asparagine synthase (glutamine-hydrolyzing), partial [Rhodothermia bacterium]
AARFNGQFALAVWDTVDKVLFLVRDRLGIKPLYFGQFNGTLVFGSELKALWSHPRFVHDLNPAAVTRYLELGYVPAPLSIFQNVWKLPPGHVLRLDGPAKQPKPAPYWSLRKIVMERQVENRPDGAIIEDFEALLRDAVRKRLIADVPVGAFLSGGIDSSLIVAMMQREAGVSVKTFSVGFEDEAFDEAPHATRIARHLQTDHTNLYVSPKEIFDLLDELPRLYDEPFADESQIPTTLLSRLARKSVTVCLSGDGGDELLGGYTRYERAARHWQRVDRIPRVIRGALRAGVRPVASFERTALGRQIATAAARLVNPTVSLGQVSRQLELAGSSYPVGFYRRSIGLDARSLAGPRLRHGLKIDSVEFSSVDAMSGLSLQETMMLTDALGYLPDDILVKVDRASMDVALEVRVPLLDYRVVEQSWTIPDHLKRRPGESKWILRELLGKYVPRSYFERPKQGFAVPLDDWLRGPMRDWGESLLNSRDIAATGLIDPKAVHALWQYHLDQGRNATTMLWRILMLQSWLRASKDGRKAENSGVSIA